MRTTFAFVFCCVAVLVAGSDIRVRGAAAEESNKQSFCTAPEYRQFDFWLGDWDAYELGSAVPEARVKISSVLGGCAVREEYDAADGHQGESLSIYDKSRGIWHQSWFTNRGQFLAIEGSFSDAAMVLTGSDRTADGEKRLVRGRWRAEGKNVRETAWRSIDGKTWQQWFDLEFKPHKQ